ncbi:MAG: hypothetical protein AAF843_15120 [Bacteroidota bacterium]
MKTVYALLLCVLCFGFSVATQANNLQITDVSFDKTTSELTFTISWDNAWFLNENYRDVVWVFAKYKNSNSNNWKPVKFKSSNIQTPSSIVAATDRDEGIYVRGSFDTPGQKNIIPSFLTIEIADEQAEDLVNASFKVFGIEMVYVPFGEYYLGDGGSNSMFFDPSAPSDPVLVNQDQTAFFARVDGINPGGITIPEFYPKGFGFLMMKYEVTQSQMIGFLNCLTRSQQESLLGDFQTDSKVYAMTTSEEPLFRNGIAYAGSEVKPGVPLEFKLDLNNNDVFNEAEDGASIACNFVYGGLALSYLDWAHCRPLSVMEYEKACRGFDDPVRDEYAWGTNSFTPTDNIINAGKDNEAVDNFGLGLANIESELNGPLRVGFSATKATIRGTSGGSFFGIMNLSDNLAELYHLASGSSNLLTERSRGDGNLLPNGQTDEAAFIDEAWFYYKGASFQSATGTVSYAHPWSLMSQDLYQPGDVGSARNGFRGGR